MNRSKRILVIILITVFIPILFITINSFALSDDTNLLSNQPVSFPVSYKDIASNDLYTVINARVYRLSDNKLTPLEFNEGLFNPNTDLFYYTLKSNDSWGADKFIYVYSILEKKNINKIEFDNSGYFKYPISLSPDFKKLVLAERAQSAGEVNIQVIDLTTKKQILTIKSLYVPTVIWTDSSNIAYFKTGKKCKEDKCIQNDLNLEKIDIDSNNIESKLISGKLQNGNLPHIANIHIRNKKITFDLQNDSSADKLQTLDITF